MVQATPDVGRVECGQPAALVCGTRADIFRLPGMGAAILIANLGIGLAVAPFAVRLIEGLLAGTSARDWRPFGLAFVVLVFVAVLASLGPARRAARIDPNRALRTE